MNKTSLLVKSFLPLTFSLLLSCNSPMVSNKASSEEEKRMELIYQDANISFFELKKISANEFDIKLSGKGFFKLVNKKHDTFYYTKKGEFKLNKKREVVLRSDDDLFLFPEVSIPFEYELENIKKNGNVLIKKDKDVGITAMLNVTYFIYPEKLKNYKEGIYHEEKDNYIDTNIYSCCFEELPFNKDYAIMKN